MTITSAEFIKGIRGTDKILYDGKPQIMFVGRSNVGKSSVINSLVKRKNLARSSSRPGKTIRLDFFLINRAWYFVDLPGYGFAHFSKKQHEDIRKMLLWYIEYSEVKNRRVVLIIDARVGITTFDQEMMDILAKHTIPFVIVVNKIDTISSSERKKCMQSIQQQAEDRTIIAYSALTGEGKQTLLRTVMPK